MMRWVLVALLFLIGACDNSVKVTIKVKTADSGTSTSSKACCQADTATVAVP